MFITDVTLLGGTSTVAITGVISEIVKRTGTVDTKWIPLISIISAILVISFGTLSFSVSNVLTGIMLGALTSGVYSNISKGVDIIKGN